MSYYEVLLFLHIALAAVWIGSAVLLHVLAMRSRSSDPAIMAAIGPHGAWIAQRVFVPASLAVLVLGVLLTIEGPWAFDQLWILLALALFAATFVVGLGMIEPTAKRLTEAIQAHGPASAEVLRLDKRLEALSWVDLAILFVVLWDMALKPRGEDVGTLLVAAIALAVAVLNLARVVRAEAAPAAA
jgi:uncharacterized membrane protein